MTESNPRLTVRREVWALARPFAISRGSKTATEVVVAEIDAGGIAGRGECVPYPHYGETVDGVVADIEKMADAVAAGLDRAGLRRAMKPGAARNAVDCALWDLAAKTAGTSAAALAGMAPLRPVVTAYTLGLDTPANMAAAAAAERHRPVLKLKLTGDGDLDRVRAVHDAVPDARLIVDA